MTLEAVALVARAAERVAQYTVELNRLRRLRRHLDREGRSRDDLELLPSVDARIEEIQGWVARLEASPAHIDCTTFDCGCPS